MFSSPTAFAMTQRTLSIRYPVPRQPKKEKDRHDIENKKVELFEQAVGAIKGPPCYRRLPGARDQRSACIWKIR